MWRKLELLVRGLEIYKNYRGEGKIMLNNGVENSDIMLILNDIKEEALLSKNILNSADGKKIKDILNFVGISVDNIYITSLYKLDRKYVSVDSNNMQKLLDILLSEISLVNPKYIITIGSEVFNILVSDVAGVDINKNNVNLYDSVGNMYNYNNMALVPIYDIVYITKATKEEKKKIVEVLKEIKNDV